MKPIVYALTDLQACYNRQLANVCSIVEESVGHNRSDIKLYTKIMPNFEYYVSTGYRVSNTFYGGSKELAGTGQENKFSGNMCRDISYLIIRQLEIKNLGICFISLITLFKVLCLSISFVDNTDLATDSENAVNDM